MPFIAPELIIQAKQMDLLTYLRNYEPYELVKFSGKENLEEVHLFECAIDLLSYATLCIKSCLTCTGATAHKRIQISSVLLGIKSNAHILSHQLIF